MKMTIALMAGGNSSEREVSLASAANVARSLDVAKYDVRLIDLNGRSWSYTDSHGDKFEIDKNDFSLTTGESKIVFDYALILIHGTPGEDGKLQGYFDIMGIPYSSCGVTSCVMTFNKSACKRAVATEGVKLAREIMIHKGDKVDARLITASLGLPVFVKPNASGSSCGVSKVKNENEINAAIEAAFLESDTVLVEEFIPGREVACGVMVAGGSEYIFPITEIIPKNEFFDYEAKYTPGMSTEITPADLPERLKKELGELTLKAYRACRCRGVVRIDYIIKDETPYMVEINSIPGMSAGGGIIPQQAAAMGMSLGELLDIIIENTMRA